jgi:hypothetical protein
MFSRQHPKNFPRPTSDFILEGVGISDDVLMGLFLISAIGNGEIEGGFYLVEASPQQQSALFPLAAPSDAPSEEKHTAVTRPGEWKASVTIVIVMQQRGYCIGSFQ